MSKSNGVQALPQSHESELAVLGAIFIDNDAYFEVSDILRPADFQSELHRRVFTAMGALITDGRPVDVVTLPEVMKAKGIKPSSEPAEYFAISLMSAVPSSVGARNYAEIVKAMATRRRLIRAAEEVANVAYDESVHIDRVTGQSERAILEATDSLVAQDMAPVSDTLMDIYDMTLARREKGGETVGLATGFSDFDRIVRGIGQDELVILAARPGMGKSALAGQIAINVASRGKRVLIFNMEMGREQVTYRLLASMARLPLTPVIEGRLNDNQWQRFTDGMGQLSNLPIQIDDTPTLTPVQLRAKARRQMARGGADLIIVDYLQLMESDGNHQNDNSRVAYISRQLKILAKEVAPVIALAQLNRSVEQRADKRPLLSDLRDSGAIEQDADKVWFLFRDEYYTKETSEAPNVAELDIAKNRQGKTGMAQLFFNKEQVAFRNLTRGAIL